MKHYYDKWRSAVVAALIRVASDEPDSGAIDSAVAVETPPDDTKGDIAFPMFPLSRILRANPAVIASEVCDAIETGPNERVVADGPYVNVFLDRKAVARETIESARAGADLYGAGREMAGERIMVEFSAPNTNKPLHLGHLRNDALGESVARICANAGADVRRVNLINDRGIHICKSMLAYHRFGEGATPESTGTKPDHFVGEYYVRFAQWAKDDPKAEAEARELLQRWEEGDPEVVELWKKMNAWAVAGISQTYARTGISFDKIYLESETYSLGRAEVLKGLDTGVFTRDEKGTVWVDLTDIGLDRKVLLRGDGTSLYLTQDIGTAMERHREWPFDRLVYVVGSEQRYHFQVLFEVLRRLGQEWARNLVHLSYGMVNLPDGKMKSREGTVVDADDLLDELTRMAEAEIRDKDRVEESAVGETAHHVAIAALHYYLLQTSPAKDMVFDPAESLSFSGDTGPYLQYVGARIASVLRRNRESGEGTYSGRVNDDEWALTKCVTRFPDVCADAARQINPSLIANHLFDTAKAFSRFYHDNPIAVADDAEVRAFRLALCESVAVVMRNGLRLLNIPFVEAM